MNGNEIVSTPFSFTLHPKLGRGSREIIKDAIAKGCRHFFIGIGGSASNDSVLPELSECTFRIAYDVTNPFCGEFGCSAVFGPQKGSDIVITGEGRLDAQTAYG